MERVGVRNAGDTHPGRFQHTEGLEGRAFIDRSFKVTIAENAALIAEAERQGLPVAAVLRGFIQKLLVPA